MSTQPLANQGRVRQPVAYAAPALTFDLAAELRSLEAEEPWQAAHTAKTLAKYPDLRVVLVALRAGGRLQQHETLGRISLQTLSGYLRVHMPEKDVNLPAGHLVALDRNVPHEVTAAVDSAFLLTIAWPDDTALIPVRPRPYRIACVGVTHGAVVEPTEQAVKVVRIDDILLARERGLDKTLADTFPCSDAFSSIPDPCLRGV